MKFIALAGLGFELVGFIVVSFYLAPLLDAHFSTKDLFFPILSLGSLLAWCIHLIWWVQKIQKDENQG